jgi:Mrp family chromosome partitioning ATPase
MFMSPEDPIQTLLITSANPREGKTTVSASVAITMATSGSKVVFVDMDMC